MNHKGTVRIETERLILRKFTKNDIDSSFKNWTSDAEMTKYLTWPTHASVEVTDKIIGTYWIDNYEKDSFYQWAIELKEIGEPVGTISVVSMEETLDMVEIGYCIGSKWWNQGIVTEAFQAVIKFLFEEVKVNRVQARHDPVNVSSGRVMQKCGMKYEGTLRQADKNNQGIVDVSVYGILASEFKK